jgi:hypothetical protein
MRRRIQEILETTRRTSLEIEWSTDDQKTLWTQRDFTYDGVHYLGGRDGDNLTLPSEAAKKLVLAGVVSVVKGGEVDRGTIKRGPTSCPVFKPWKLANASNAYTEEVGSFDNVLVRIRLTRDSYQLLPALDLRPYESFYVPFAVIKNSNHGVETDDFGGFLPPV